MKNNLNTSNYILDFDFPIPKDLQNNFQGIFSYIKKKFQIKFSRKSHIDSLLKKCKGKFFKTIHEIMNMSLNIKIKRLPQKFITNITIEYNQKYLKKNIIEVYQDFNLLPDFNTLVEKGFIKNNRKELLYQFCSCNLISLYNIYIGSQRYSDDINDVKKNDGRRIGILYKFVSKNFCNYFQNNKPHLIKTKENHKENHKSICNVKNNDENNNDNNIYDNICNARGKKISEN